MHTVVDDAVDYTDEPRTRRILVVDDEAAVRRSIARILHREGYQVTCADSAEAALVLIDRTPNGFDLVISDIVMGGMSGVVLGQRLRSSGAGVRVMLISGYPGIHLGDEALAAGAFDFLPKPFTPSQLSDRVRENIARDEHD